MYISFIISLLKNVRLDCKDPFTLIKFIWQKMKFIWWSYISRNNTLLYLTSTGALNTVYEASAEGNKFLAHVIRHGVYLWNIKGLCTVGPGHRCTFYVHDTVRRKILSQQLPLGPSKLTLLDHSYDLLSGTLQVTISKSPYWIFMIVLLTLCGCIVCFSQLRHNLVPNLISS